MPCTIDKQASFYGTAHQQPWTVVMFNRLRLTCTARVEYVNTRDDGRSENTDPVKT